ncbi:MAG: hypothetical protein J7L14_02320 [Candidatus Diapherotrites archaeon]|nr:hypothetical protein [Candidatus Diapherotrites archaeon]
MRTLRAKAISLFVAIVVCALLLFSGCVERKLSSNERLLCMDLTSYSFAEIPECKTISKCFEIVDGLFDKRIAGFEIFRFKNYWANSLFYASKARKNTEEIYKMCERNNVANLGERILELRHNIEKAYEFSDKAFEESVKFMEERADYLATQELERIKDSDIYAAFIELKANIAALKKATKDEELYVNKYKRISAEIESLAKRTIGFGYYVDIENSLRRVIESKLKFSNSIVVSILLWYLDSLTRGHKLEILRELRPGKFGLYLTKITSIRDGVFIDFVKIANKETRKLNDALQQRELIVARCKENIAKTRKILQELEEKIPDRNIDLLLEKFYNSNTVAFSNELDFELNDFVERKRKRLDLLEEELLELQSKIYFNRESLGKTLEEARNLEGKIKAELYNAEFVNTNVIVKLEELCEERLQNAELPQELKNNTQLITLWASFELAKNEFMKTKDLVYCNEGLQLLDALKKAAQNSRKFNREILSRFSKCLKELKLIFEKSLDAAINLSDFEQRFMLLEEIEINNENGFHILKQCEELREDIREYLQRSTKIAELNMLFENLLERENSIQKIIKTTHSKRGFSSYLESIAKIEKFFNEGKLKLEYIDKADEIKEKIETLIFEVDAKLNSFALKLFFDSLQVIPVETFYEKGTVVGRYKLVWINNQHHIDSEAEQCVEIKAKSVDLLSASENIAKASLCSKGILIKFNKIPVGLSYVDVNIIANSEIVVNKKLLRFSQSEAVIEYSLRSTLPMTQIGVELPDVKREKIRDIIVMKNYDIIPFRIVGNAVVFKLLDKAKILFFIYEPIRISFTQRNNCFDFLLENELPFKTKQTRIEFPLVFSNSIKEASCSNCVVYTDGSKFWTNAEFLEKEKKKLQICLELSDDKAERMVEEAVVLIGELETINTAEAKELANKLKKNIEGKTSKETTVKLAELIAKARNLLEREKNYTLMKNNLMERIESIATTIRKITSIIELPKADIIGERLSKAKNILNAEHLDWDSLAKANALLDVDQIISDMLKERLAEIDINSELVEGNAKEKLQRKIGEFESLINKNSFVNAAKKLDEIIKTIEMNSRNSNEKKSNAILLKKKYIELLDSIAREVKFLEGLFVLPFEEFIAVGYVPPITPKRLNSIKLKLVKLDSVELREATPEELTKNRRLFNKLKKYTEELEEIYSEILEAKKRIKRDAIASFNSLVEMFNSGMLAENIKTKLAKAKEEITNKNYLKGLFIARTLMKEVKTNTTDLFYLLPILVMFAIAAIIRYKKIREDRKRKEKLKEILEAWE